MSCRPRKPRRSRQQTVEAAIAELDGVREEWMRRPGVTALDVGYAFRDGKMTDDIVIRVHVRRKLPLESIREHERFPERLGNFLVDVIEAEYGPEASDSTSVGPDLM